MQTSGVYIADSTTPSISSSVASNRAVLPSAPIDASTQVSPLTGSKAVQARSGIEQDKERQSSQSTDVIVSEQELESKLDAHVEYDRDTQGHRGAISVYLQTQHAAKREEIQQMVGVDLYA